jgi:hypothetical protein
MTPREALLHGIPYHRVTADERQLMISTDHGNEPVRMREGFQKMVSLSSRSTVAPLFWERRPVSKFRARARLPDRVGSCNHLLPAPTRWPSLPPLQVVDESIGACSFPSPI